MNAESTGPKLVAVQCEHPSDPRRDVPRILGMAARSVEKGGIAVLPEYAVAPPRALARDLLEGLASMRDLVADASATCEGALVVTVPEIAGGHLYNTAFVAEGGKIVHAQRKVRPTEGERGAGVQASSGVGAATVQGVRLGVLVCADVLALDLVAAMRDLRPDVVAVPVHSRNRPDDITRDARTAVFVARAWDLGAYVVKAGGHARPDVVGRSLITAPWGVLAQARDDFESTLLGARFDRGRIEVVRRTFAGLGEP